MTLTKETIVRAIKLEMIKAGVVITETPDFNPNPTHEYRFQYTIDPDMISPSASILNFQGNAHDIAIKILATGVEVVTNVHVVISDKNMYRVSVSVANLPMLRALAEVYRRDLIAAHCLHAPAMDLITHSEVLRNTNLSSTRMENTLDYLWQEDVRGQLSHFVRMNTAKYFGIQVRQTTTEHSALPYYEITLIADRMGAVS